MENKENKIGFFSYFFAVLSFLPVLGILFMVGAISYGIAKRKNGGNKLIIISLIAFIFQIGMFSSIFIGKDSIWNEAQENIIKKNLIRTSKNLNIYKKHFNRYPQTLDELKRYNLEEDKEYTYLYENSEISFIPRKIQFFQYKNIGSDKYKLFSIGMDKKINTKDDIYIEDLVD